MREDARQESKRRRRQMKRGERSQEERRGPFLVGQSTGDWLRSAQRGKSTGKEEAREAGQCGVIGE